MPGVKGELLKKAGWVLAASLVMALGCNPEPYGPCTLPSNDTIKQACTGSGEDGGDGGAVTTSEASCVVDFVFECESQLCGTYQGSNPFCTERCEGPDDTGCPQGGTCIEFVPTTGQFYCVGPDQL